MPCEIAGRIDKRGDRDWYAFTAKKGEAVVIDLWADRLGDQHRLPVLRPSLATAKTDLVEKDDNPEILSNTQFFARTTDPDPYVFTAPEDGKYLVQVTSREANYLYGPKTTYRLRVGPPRPDFRVVAMAGQQEFAGADRPAGRRQPIPGGVRLPVRRVRRPDHADGRGLPPGVTCAAADDRPGPAVRVRWC